MGTTTTTPLSHTVRVSNIPQSATAKDLLDFLESTVGPSTVFALEIFSDNPNWKSRGFGRVQFETLDARSRALSLSQLNHLLFHCHFLRLSETDADIIFRPQHRLHNGVLYAGFVLSDHRISVLESWEGVAGWVLPQRKRLDFWVWHNGDCYRLEFLFEDILESHGYCLGEDAKLNALLLKMKFGPRIYKKKTGADVAAKFRGDRYRFCKEDFEFLWVRTTDFSPLKSIGHSTSFCWEIVEEHLASDVFKSFPLYKENLRDLALEDGEEFCSLTEAVPLVKRASQSKLPYEALFQLNSLVHTQKISLASVDDELIDLLAGLDEETRAVIFQKLHKMSFTCYEPLKFVKTQLHVLSNKKKGLPQSSQKRLTDSNIMSCHRALITPTKIYCLGPELETSNHVVKHFASHASDFMRITFVEENWNKLPTNAVSTGVQKGLFSKPLKTEIYKRILTILRDGIVIGSKRFEFLAFSASQLRSNSVWLFASNDNLKAADIREWMGCFNNIRSVSKCAARMGQLFSSSMQTFEVASQDVEIIPDIDFTSDGVSYCFSDGIGKISQCFARQVA